MLGFFATERYVAEVAPDPIGVAGVPVPAPARPAGALTEDPDTGSLAAFGSPLASAAPARARTAPARNGAAAWAEAGRSSAPAVPAPRSEAPSSFSAALAASTDASRRTATRPAAVEPDDARLDELAGLLGVAESAAAEPAAPSRTPVARASFPRATRESTPLAHPAADHTGDVVDDAAATAAPSPFTAALARMVAGDRDVQHAVREALETSDAARSGEDDGEDDCGAERVRPEHEATSQPAVWSRATRQKEETVGDQVIAPPSTSIDERTELDSWTAEPAFLDEPPFLDESVFLDEMPFLDESPLLDEPVFLDEMPIPDEVAVEPAEPARAGEPAVAVEQAAATEPAASREEAIAEVLRAALAEGHSDEALAGILRKVVAGDSPQAALVEPSAADEPAPVVEEPAAETPAPPVTATGSAAASVAAPTPVEPSARPMPELPARAVVEAPFELFPSVAPAAPSSAGVSLWGEPSAATTAALSTSADVTPASQGARIWGEAQPEAEPDQPEVPTEVEIEVEIEAEIDAEIEAGVQAEVEAEVSVAEATEEAAALDVEPAPLLARTASDPAPVQTPRPSMSMDATTVMPPLSLLPGAPSRGRGLPPVPPRTSRPPVPPPSSATRTPAAPPADGADVPSPARPAPELLATVTRLPVAPLMATPETPDMPELADLAELIEDDATSLFGSPEPPAVPARPARVRIAPPSTPEEVVSRLAALGVPADLLDSGFTADVSTGGTYSALTRTLGDRLPEAPELPTGAGDVLFVVGPGVETLRAARSLAATLRLDPDRVQWATRGDLVGLAPESSRMSTIDTALSRRQDASASGTVTIVAVDAPLRTDAYWMSQMLAIWSPVAVWAVVEATRKPEDIEHWVDGLARVDALIVQDTDLSADPAAVLSRLTAPVAVVDGVRATPHRWASVLCERLETAPA
ncbi:hypothetical protein [Candidatus Blastococcus massiliensis]|uniref:hypothetical protein n=1 Tax=Candidatus Blastococcus massiliensis TaxID=1470358 RepID=UPI0012DBE0A1|nr:hypothetical protein [Candidatus Blastococcus massiliensis]